jgi:hypothetical protein
MIGTIFSATAQIASASPQSFISAPAQIASASPQSFISAPAQITSASPHVFTLCCAIAPRNGCATLYFLLSLGELEAFAGAFAAVFFPFFDA